MNSLERCICLALLLFLSILCKENVFAWEYCNEETVGYTCSKGVMHYMCHTEGDLFIEETLRFITTEWSEYMPITPLFRQKMIDLHNDFRNKVASGDEVSTLAKERYPIASRFREFVWDVELEYLCEISIKMALTIKHDKCRGTLRFAFPGQNLGAGNLYLIPTPPWSGERSEYMVLVNDSMIAMFNEKNLVRDPVNYPKALRAEDGPAGHYNQMVNDRSGRIGCSTGVGVNCTNPEPYGTYPACWYVCCNFEFTVGQDEYVYKTHPTTPASECSQFGSGKSKTYKNLCANSGGIYPPFEFGEDIEFDSRFEKVKDKTHIMEIWNREGKYKKPPVKKRPPPPQQKPG